MRSFGMLLKTVGIDAHNFHKCCCCFKQRKWQLSVQGSQNLRVADSAEMVPKIMEVGNVQIY
jgi:hypothetical protein